MTKDEAMQALLREYPNGVSFAPMALRLLVQKVPLEDWQIEELKAEMFQFGDKWFSREMICDDESWLGFLERAKKWLMEYGFFSVERLHESCCGVLRPVATPADFASLLRHLSFTVDARGKSGFFCFQPPPSLDQRLAATSKTITELLEREDGTLALNQLEGTMPHLTTEALEGIRVQFLPEVHNAEVGGVPCWRSAEAIHLPEDFAEKLTTAVDTLVALKETVSVAKLAFALNLCYCIRFREEYALPDNGTFMRVCAKHYQGSNDVFPNTKILRASGDGSSGPRRRVRSPNTRFRNLGVSIGAELVFTKDSHITCTVRDDSNQVEYGGKTWAISALASHLLNVPVANGFYHFSHGGESLWQRRARLEREGAPNDDQTKAMPPPAAMREAEGDTIGFEGNSLSPPTWRRFCTDGTNPRVAEWARRVDNGTSVEQIASASGYVASTIISMIANYRLYATLCKPFGIAPEDVADV